MSGRECGQENCMLKVFLHMCLNSRYLRCYSSFVLLVFLWYIFCDTDDASINKGI